MIENKQIYKSLLVDFILELSVLIFGWLTYKLYQPFFLTYFAKNIYIHNFYLFFYHLNIKYYYFFHRFHYSRSIKPDQVQGNLPVIILARPKNHTLKMFQLMGLTVEVSSREPRRP